MEHALDQLPDLEKTTNRGNADCSPVAPTHTLSRLRASFIVGNPKGLHTRPSAELARCASSFRAQIYLHHHRNSVNAKSLLGILTLAAGKGSKIFVEAEGEDAAEAIEAILRLAENRFFLNY